MVSDPENQNLQMEVPRLLGTRTCPHAYGDISHIRESRDARLLQAGGLNKHKPFTRVVHGWMFSALGPSSRLQPEATGIHFLLHCLPSSRCERRSQSYPDHSRKSFPIFRQACNTVGLTLSGQHPWQYICICCTTQLHLLETVRYPCGNVTCVGSVSWIW